MVAKTPPTSSLLSKEEGQSIFEFLIFLPLLLGFAFFLYRIQVAIQVSIANQQYARAQALFLTFNNAFYPELDKQGTMRQKKSNQMVLGVSDNLATGDTYSPTATTQSLNRLGKPGGSDSPQEEPSLRGKIRIRNTVTLCTPSVSFPQGGTAVESLSLGSAVQQFPAIGLWQWTENTDWGGSYCRSSLTYE